jgi:sodium-dependent dicarboxylate transporter 2/3/5
MNMHPLLLMMPAAMAASCGFMLPVGTPPNAIAFGTGHLTIPQMARAGLVLDLIGPAIITLVAYYIAVPVFGIEVGTLPEWVR